MATETPALQLATPGDALGIARLSRDRIESGLGWRWTAGRVLRSIEDAETNVLIAVAATRAVVGFGIMKYDADEAHLLLLAVQPAVARRGVGSALVGWLEASATTAGVDAVSLESRVSNAPARAFYRRLGYVDVQELPGYYQGREAAVRMTKRLRLERSAPA